MSKITIWGVWFLTCAATLGCGSEDEGGKNNGSSGNSGTGGTAGASGTGGSGRGGSSPGGTGGTCPGGVPHVDGEPDDSVDTDLPPVPRMTNVKATVIGNTVSITFDPIDGAVDYRVYALPADSDISVDGDGFVTIPNAFYRCAGNRMASPATVDGASGPEGGYVTTLVDGQDVGGFRRTLEGATLGYVFAEPGEGRVPVYALGESASNADNSCYFQRWGASRAKQYVTSEAERDALLADGFRDDGIAFYAPAEGTAGTVQISTSTGMNARYYFADGPEASMRQGAEPAFQALAATTAGALPLMRVYYENGCGLSHDELVAGASRFDRARYQGSDVPLWALTWSGIASGETVLVVEALDVGCPIGTGIWAATSAAELVNSFGGTLAPYFDEADARADNPEGALYINGQHAETNRPRAMARTFVRVTPAPEPDLDWFMGFDTPESLGAVNEIDCGGDPDLGNCFQTYRQVSEHFDSIFMFVEETRHAITPAFGQLWVSYADWESDVPGKFRITPTTRGTMSANNYLYATMQVSAFTSDRRYPQILISDAVPPVQYGIRNGNTIVVQTFGDWPNQFQLEVCDHVNWDVNLQCPRLDLRNVNSDDGENLLPNAEVGEEVGVDRSTLLEVYASTERIYLLLAGKPYACANLPASGIPSGEVTVTYGDVLYHSGVDKFEFFPYMAEHLQTDSIRHYDNLGFKSGVAAPDWDETRFPCSNGSFN